MERSEKAATRLRRRHDQVNGVSPDGVAYDAHDPELLLWVWATLVDTARLLYERCVRPLSDEERERYYREQKLFAYACGVPQGSATIYQFPARVFDIWLLLACHSPAEIKYRVHHRRRLQLYTHVRASHLRADLRNNIYP